MKLGKYLFILMLVLVCTTFCFAKDGQVLFNSTDQPQSLSKDWVWSQGESQDSNYRISPETGAVTIISGRRTVFWSDRNSAPHIDYLLSGDFEVQVKLNFNPDEHGKVAGLAIRSSETPNTWVALRRNLGDYQEINAVQNQNGSSKYIPVTMQKPQFI